jgi:hypothetical protein
MTKIAVVMLTCASSATAIKLFAQEADNLTEMDYVVNGAEADKVAEELFNVIVEANMNGEDPLNFGQEDDFYAEQEAAREMTPEEAFEAYGDELLEELGIECRNGENNEICMEIYAAHMNGEDMGQFAEEDDFYAEEEAAREMTPEEAAREMTPAEAFEVFGPLILEAFGVDCRNEENAEVCMEIFDANMNGEDLGDFAEEDDFDAEREAAREMTPEEAFEVFGPIILEELGVDCRNEENAEVCMEIFAANMNGEDLGDFAEEDDFDAEREMTPEEAFEAYGPEEPVYSTGLIVPEEPVAEVLYQEPPAEIIAATEKLAAETSNTNMRSNSRIRNRNSRRTYRYK